MSKAKINEQGLQYNINQRQPATINAQQSTNFKMTLTRIPNVTFWCTAINIPSISIGDVPVSNMFAPLHVPGSSIQYDQLRVTFQVDEEFANWKEIHNWMRGVVPFEDFRQIIPNDQDYYSDIMIHCLNSSKNPSYLFTVKKAFPVNIDGFDLSVALTEPEPVTISATFVFETFDIQKVT
jgi:hypothetical protein